MICCSMDLNETQIINFEKICRLCLNEQPILNDIFEPNVEECSLSIDQKIMVCASIDLCRNDGLPTQICDKCLSSVNAAFDFRIQCENADKTLHDINALLLLQETDNEKSNESFGDKTEIQSNKETAENFDHMIVINKEHLPNSRAKYSDKVIYIVSDSDLEKKVEGKEVKKKQTCLKQDSFVIPTSSGIGKTEGKADFEVQSTDDFQNLEKRDVHKPGENLSKMPCPFCNKMLARIDEHIRLLHRNRVYKCTKYGCGAEFLTLKNLQSHQLNCFNIKKAYKCSKCFKEFHRKSNFKAHIKRHSNKKDFQCQLCDRAFVDSTGLRRHFLKHHEPEQEVFVSGCCGKRFKSKEGLKKHIRRGICGIQILQIVQSEPEWSNAGEQLLKVS